MRQSACLIINGDCNTAGKLGLNNEIDLKFPLVRSSQLRTCVIKIVTFKGGHLMW